MNHHDPKPVNGGEDRTKHSVNQIKEDRAACACTKDEHKNDLSAERNFRRATVRLCMALDAGRRSETGPETVISGPETVRPLKALEAGRRDNAGSETATMRPETVEPTPLTSDRGTTNKTVYAIGERLAVLRHVAEKYGLRLDRTANMMAFGRRNTNGEATAICFRQFEQRDHASSGYSGTRTPESQVAAGRSAQQ